MAYRASSTSPSSQSSKINSMLYQKQFQPNTAGMRMAQHFPGQFNPQVQQQVSNVHIDCHTVVNYTLLKEPFTVFIFRFYLSPTSSLLWFDRLTIIHLVGVSSALPWVPQCHPMWVVVLCLIPDPNTHSTSNILHEDPLVPPLDPETHMHHLKLNKI